MEKLIELLNERMKEEEKIWPKHSRFLNYDGINHVFRLDNGCSFCMEFVLSKRYWFIQRLVENDKIDTAAYKTVYSWDLDKRKTLTMSSNWDEFYQVIEHWVYESLLMLLSISDTPIDDLISYLK